MKHLSFFAVALVLGLTLALVALSSYPAQAATYYVDDDNCPGPRSGTQADPFCSIQSGIHAAFSGDTVQVAPGTYEHIVMKSGVVIQGAGAGDDPLIHSIIDGGGTGSVVTAIAVDSAAKLDGFKITNGGGSFGGGMRNVSSSPEVSNCTFSGNSATFGGGGMFNDSSSPTVTNCTFSGNSVTDSSGSYGGGMYNNDSSPTVSNCTFSENSARFDGGGMYNSDSSPTVSNCTLSGNSARFVAGGMYNDSSSPTVTNCTFSANSARFVAGGMYNVYSSPTLTNCTFSGNSANFGAGMFNDSSSPTVTNCTFSANLKLFLERGVGMYNRHSYPTVTNCILWGDTPIEIENYDSSPVVAYSDIQGGYAGTGNINADPMFLDPDGPDNVIGTEDDNLHLKSGSPCIDTGTAIGAPDTDIEGKPRPLGKDYDMGAYEF